MTVTTDPFMYPSTMYKGCLKSNNVDRIGKLTVVMLLSVLMLSVTSAKKPLKSSSRGSNVRGTGNGRKPPPGLVPGRGKNKDDVSPPDTGGGHGTPEGVSMVHPMSPMAPASLIGGIDTTINDFPWAIVFVRYYSGYGWYATCGGAIIDRYWVVTAAHCLDGIAEPVANNIWLLAGSSSVNVYGEHSQALFPSQVYIHPSRASASNKWMYDLALLKLSSPAYLSGSHVRAAIITPYADMFTNIPCQVVGWGLKSIAPSVYSQTLMVATMYPMSRSICQWFYWGDWVTNNQICAWNGAGTNVMTCYGDSGSPLTYGLYLVGLVSYGVSGCKNTHPNVFIQPASFRSWIWQTTGVYSL